jgi:type IV pilus assembly protein PilE
MLQLRMEQRYQDETSYSAAPCNSAPALADFEIRCTVDSAGQAYVAQAVGKGRLAGYEYTIDHSGTKRTTRHPRGAPSDTCWSIKGRTCEM